MTIQEVKTAYDIEWFHGVLDRVYKGDNEFIYPIMADVEAVFDLNKNQSFRNGAARRWVALDSAGLPAGRIAAFYTVKPKSGKRGGIGFFESIQNEEIAAALFDIAEAWLLSESCLSIDAPVNFGDRDSYWGLLISATTPTSYRENYHPKYYQPWFLSRGYKLEIEQNTYDIVEKEFNYERFSKIAERVMSKPGYRFEFFRYNQLDKYAADFVSIYNEAWAFHDDFEPLQYSVLHKRLKEIKPAMPEEFAIFAYDHDKPIGFFIAILEINQVLKNFKGKMGWWQKIQFMLQRSQINKAKGIVFGIVPSHQNLGVETGLIIKFHQGNAKTQRMQSMELAWVGDFNPKMISMLESLGAKKTKIHHTYRKEI